MPSGSRHCESEPDAYSSLPPITWPTKSHVLPNKRPTEGADETLSSLRGRSMMTWHDTEIQVTLDAAEELLRETSSRLKLPVKIIRKERSVGAVPQDATVYEVLEEMAISVQTQLQGMPLPFCAFNGCVARSLTRASRPAPRSDELLRLIGGTTSLWTLATSSWACRP